MSLVEETKQGEGEPVLAEQTPAAPEKLPSLLRNRDYMLLWSGQVISSIGTQASQLAFPLLVLALTRSPAQAGFAGALRALPYLIFSLPAGALIDRHFLDDQKELLSIIESTRPLIVEEH